MARKKTMSIGTRVLHNTNKEFSEGVVVHIASYEKNICVKNNTPFSVHWSNGIRGYYSFNEISRINPTSTLKQMQKEVIEDEE